MYDPALGRWHVLDPLADLAPGITPYRYGFNNPVSFTDPTGMYEYTDGYQRHDSKYSSGAVHFSGMLSESSGGLGGDKNSSGGRDVKQTAHLINKDGTKTLLDTDYNEDVDPPTGGGSAQSGGGDPLQKHINEAYTLDEWMETYKNTSYFRSAIEARPKTLGNKPMV